MKILCITPITDTMMKNLLSKGEVSYYPNLKKKQIRDLLTLKKYDVIFTNPNKQNFMLDEDLLDGSNISIICTASTGLNHIDLDYCKKNSIKTLSITKDYVILDKITSTAEHSFGLMMALIRNIPKSFGSVKKGQWDWEKYIGRQIDHLTIGIVGLGRLGKMMARYCQAFGAKVLVYDPYVAESQYQHVGSLQELFDLCDVVSLHVHVSDETKHFINKDLFNKATKSPYLINTSRGEIVNEIDVIRALEEGHLAGYATDVVEDEFGDLDDSQIIKRSEDLNIIVTPHIGGMCKEAREIAYNAAINKL
jgi:D-3-phosphoglycerate dehydrogenase